MKILGLWDTVEGSSWTETKKECETNKPKISTGLECTQKLESDWERARLTVLKIFSVIVKKLLKGFIQKVLYIVSRHG